MIPDINLRRGRGWGNMLEMWHMTRYQTHANLRRGHGWGNMLEMWHMIDIPDTILRRGPLVKNRTWLTWSYSNKKKEPWVNKNLTGLRALKIRTVSHVGQTGRFLSMRIFQGQLINWEVLPGQIRTRAMFRHLHRSYSRALIVDNTHCGPHFSIFSKRYCQF